jgi:uncharacterized OB-fold protein
MADDTADLARPFWHAAERERFVLPRCGTCATVYPFPFHRCGACGGTTLRWIDGPREAVLHSWTTTMRTLHPAFRGPFRVGLAELSVGGGRVVHYVTTMPLDPPDDKLAVGDRLVLTFLTVPNGRRAPAFVPVRTAA